MAETQILSATWKQFAESSPRRRGRALLVRRQNTVNMYSIMPTLDTDPRLLSLLHTPGLWRGSEHCARAADAGEDTLSTGFPTLDACLPWQGWPAAALVEIITPQWGIGELQLVLPLLRRLSQQGRTSLWIAPPCPPYAPALLASGIDPACLYVVSATPAQALWSIEKALQDPHCALVMAWPGRLHSAQVRRLQLAASTGGTLGILFHHGTLRQSPAVLRLQVDATAQGLRVEVLKARGSYRQDTVALNRGLP